jgi:hypothetical protein
MAADLNAITTPLKLRSQRHGHPRPCEYCYFTNGTQIPWQ